MPGVETVSEKERLASLAQHWLHEPSIALDTESDSYHRYPAQGCLLQVATASGVWVVDPIALRDLSPLGPVLSDPRIEKIFHAADNDIRVLDRFWGLRVRNVFDTGLAARFIGLRRPALDTVLNEVLGVRIEKSEELQRGDWGVRPLSDAALAYAAEDVAHLLPLRDRLRDRVESLGRAEWVAEEFNRLESIRYTPPDPPEVSFLFLKGSHVLDGRGLAVLRDLVVFREAEARRRTLPPSRLLPDHILVALAQEPKVDLPHVPGLGPVELRRLGPGLKAAIKSGLASPPFARPPQPPRDGRPTDEQEGRLRGLKRWRNAHAERLDLDPALVWPMTSLERLARDPAARSEEMSSPAVRRWQRDEFGPSLRKLLSDGSPSANGL